MRAFPVGAARVKEIRRRPVLLNVPDGFRHCTPSYCAPAHAGAFLCIGEGMAPGFGASLRIDRRRALETAAAMTARASMPARTPELRERALIDPRGDWKTPAPRR